MTTVGRNDPCHCGSGKKYKKCHLEADEKSDRKEREKAALNAAKVAAANAEEEKKGTPSGASPKKSQEPQRSPGWMQKVAGKVGFFRNVTQRRTGPSSKGG